MTDDTTPTRPDSDDGTAAAAQFRFLWYAGEWPSTIRALRHRNFRLFWFGQMVSLVGTWMQNTAQSWLVFALAKTEYGPANASFYVGAVSAMGSLPMFLLTLYAGVISDRYDRRRILIATQTILGLLAAGLAMLVGTGTIRLWHVAVFAVCSGLTMAFDMPTRQAFVKDMATPEDLVNAIALNSSVFNLARIIGPGVAGWLMSLSIVGISGVLYLNAASYIAVIVGLVLIHVPAAAVRARAGSVWEHLLEGFRYVAGHRVIRLLMILMAIYSVFGFSYAVLMPVIANQVLHQTESGYGIMLGATGTGAFIGAVFLASAASRIRKGRLLLASGLIFTVPLILFSQITRLPAAYVGATRLALDYHLSLLLLAFIGSGLVMASASINSAIQEIVPDHLRGRVVSIWAFIFAGFTPIGALYAGTIAHYTSSLTVLLIGGLVTLLTIISITLRARWLWSLP